MTMFLQIFIFIGLVGGAAFIFSYYKKKKNETEKNAWIESRKYCLLHILVPKNNEKAPVSAEQMFASLHGIFRPEEKWQEQISFEIISRKKFIHFYAHVPVALKDFVEGQIYAQYPNVDISEVEDYSLERPEGTALAGAELVLNKEDVYPIKTFINFTVDPLASITSVLTKTINQEEVWIQIITRPVSDTWQDRGVSYVEAIRSGTPTSTTIWGKILNALVSFIIDIARTAANRPADESTGGEVKLSGPQDAALKGIETKITKLGFATKIRVLVFSDTANDAQAKVNIVSGAFKQFNLINLNGFEVGPIQLGNDFLKNYQKRYFADDGYILNIEELASVYHLPNTTVETPNIVWAGSKKGEPPSNLPAEGRVDPQEVALFGKTDYRHMVHRFGIKTKDRRLHMYAIGKTGTGKSTMLENMIINDIQNGRGVAVIDPHGELINHILDFVPNERIKDVIYFNPADSDWPIGFNPLESVDPDLKNIVASGVVGIFKKIFGQSWGPRLEYILRNAILALLDYPDSTLLGVMRVLVDKEFRKLVVAQIKDPVVKDFFVNEYNQWDQKFRLEAIQSIQNKVGQFLSSSSIRNIVGQPKSTFDIRSAMDQGKILLIDLSIGKIGEDNAALLGSLLITKIQLAAMQRVDIPEKDRRDFYLYVDEFQNFATDSFAVILSEARKYHLNLIMTHQYIAQMPEVVSQAVFGNVGTIISFRVGSSDSSILAKELEPVFEANDLVNLDNYHIYIKMAIDGVTRPAFSAITLPPSQGKNNNRDEIISFSREKYGKLRSQVEEKIAEWSDSSRQDALGKSNDFKKSFTEIDKILEKDSAVEKQKGDFYYLEYKVKNNEKWYIPTRKVGETAKQKEEIEDNTTENRKQILMPILEKRRAKAELKKEIDELITLTELDEVLDKVGDNNSKNMKDNFKKLQSGEQVKID